MDGDRNLESLGLVPLDGDMVECDICSLSSVCPMSEPGFECRMTDKKWLGKFTTDIIGDMDNALGHLLELQAERVDDMIRDVDPERTVKQKEEHQVRIDKNIDKLFKNGLALRNAKLAKLSNRYTEEGPSLPEKPTPQMYSEAIDALERAGFDRGNITPTDARRYLGDLKEIAPAPEPEVF